MLDPQFLAPNAVAHWASVTPDAIATQEVGGESLTYSQLHEHATRWADALAGLGVVRGERVATMIPNGATNHACWLGIAWCGAIEVPINTQFFGEMLLYVLRDCAPTVLVIGARILDDVAAVVRDVPSLRQIVAVGGPPPSIEGLQVADGHALVAAASSTAAFAAPVARDTACLLYTSGTTGRAKGVLAPWGLVHQLWSWVPADALGVGDGVYCAFQMFHNSGKACLNAALARGARFIFRDRFSATHFWDDVRATQPKAATLVGPMTALLADAPRADDDADNSLEAVLLGPLIPDIEDFERRFGVRAATCYSQTEVGTPLATGWERGPWQSCGRPRSDYPWTEVRIVDGDDEPVAVGVVGELVVRTAEPWALSSGYFRNAELTASAWRNGWFHTGDAFRTDEDGWFYLVDRLVDTIRRRGENIASQDVEKLVGANPAVGECAAFAVPGSLPGDHEVMVVVVPAADAHGQPRNIDLDELHADLVERMPMFMVPRYLEVMTTLPRNATTLRVRKDELRRRGVVETTRDNNAPMEGTT